MKCSLRYSIGCVSRTVYDTFILTFRVIKLKQEMCGVQLKNMTESQTTYK